MYAVEKYYKKDLENYLSNLSNEKSNNVIINNNLAFTNQPNTNQLNTNQPNTNQPNTNQPNNDGNEEYDENQEQQQINDLQNEETQQKVLEHENLLNR